eukprot:Gregarina_sp_Poly_1__7162@NODE_392_length_8959_cov_63_078835_g321_i0_p15_GENE_NODE_392_length_8959_cov_63_078835_g321_i0NODE_392_length_8959_cov_63_078835_g321_i0_p15_ORF_typecomplete_len110_score13_26CTP_synth_N/PF06418_14/0_054_NODE_392_length_8959_cov_63_078835_g321_i054005729
MKKKVKQQQRVVILKQHNAVARKVKKSARRNIEKKEVITVSTGGTSNEAGSNHALKAVTERKLQFNVLNSQVICMPAHKPIAQISGLPAPSLEKKPSRSSLSSRREYVC